MMYEFEKYVNVEKLEQEILASNISTRYDGMASMGNQLKIMVTIELDAEELNTLQTILNAHTTGASLQQIVKIKREEAQNFAREIYDQFIEENIALGITQLGLTSHVRKTCRELSDALLSGSLYDTVLEVALISPADLDANILTGARLLSFRNKIEDFLSVPRATAWNQSKTW